MKLGELQIKIQQKEQELEKLQQNEYELKEEVREHQEEIRLINNRLLDTIPADLRIDLNRALEQEKKTLATLI